jgi:hypothetical protein
MHSRIWKDVEYDTCPVVCVCCDSINRQLMSVRQMRMVEIDSAERKEGKEKMKEMLVCTTSKMKAILLQSQAHAVKLVVVGASAHYKPSHPLELVHSMVLRGDKYCRISSS